ncbi:MAG: single-stranded-DNA-specific exonuclease RecJ [Candidatus Woykebacteria bacterium RIFCSPLOWO2_01_FULL_41_12]|uniref:Single-stranded-DNA-specific exonuclease RecJ n=1 Tax=Candidatus Woykebacteria bacterium RIFCSPLOWO2_01_FULL_41_12 TaxID=1802604 RepID=A0A1G1WZ58_9BACT|nr:MAG: single-stranded-DNA-specific exonuclease RecJ [Candidatus Woykebacteria bacterium RIFCSPLOWO2_01_FULL_41_12]
MEKTWKVLDENPKDLRRTLLKNRNVEDADSFFQPHLYRLTPVNKLFPSLDKAIERIKRAIKEKDLIFIYGDFDVDGITGTAILWETIDFLGGRVLPFIPHREKEGYGIHSDAIEHIAKQGAKVIVSVDCGITAVAEAEVAKRLGVDLIITDHHSLQTQIPKAYAVIHTDTLAGSGVAFMLAKALLEFFNKEADEQFFKNLELASIGTIADMVPLISDNRIIVANGLHSLNKSERLGLKALYNEAGLNKKIGTYEVGFIISPRLNAAGRMENALDSLRLLLTKNKDRASRIASQLSVTNKRRQEAMAESLGHARSSLKGNGGTKILIAHHESYLPGIIGLVAGRLVDEFYKPSIVISEIDPLSRGSARSIKGFNIAEAIGKQKDYLQSHGGHPMAAGFSIEKEKIPVFKEKILNYAEKTLSEKDFTPTLKIDARLDVDHLDKGALQVIKEFEPFGVGNGEPTFVTSDFEVVSAKAVGNGGKHLRMVLRGRNYRLFNSIAFGLAGRPLKKGDLIDAVYNLKEDSWSGNGRIELRVKDLQFYN